MLALIGGKIGASLIGGAAAIAIILGGFLYIKNHYTREGYTKAITEMAARDGKAIKKGDEIEKQIGLCFDRGGEWNTSTGKCEGGTQ